MVALLNRLYGVVANADYVFLLVLVFVAVGLVVSAVTLLIMQRGVFRERVRRHLQPPQPAQPTRARLVEGNDEASFRRRVETSVHPAVAPSNEAERKELRLTLVQAGFRSQRAYRNYLTSRFLCATLCPSAYLMVLFAYQLTILMLLTGLVLAMAGFYLPLWVVRYLARRRRTRIWRALPDALDLMVVCAEAGLGLDLIVRRVGEEIRPINVDLSDELSLMNLEVQAGKSRDEAYKNAALRMGVPEVRSLLSVLGQASRFGTSIAQTLRIHADELRLKRRQMAEETAAVLGTKMLFPVVVFIFPGIFIVLLGPAGIQMVRILFPILKGQGG
jgi:tight adherence protein C